jgi:hypothetical protein
MTARTGYGLTASVAVAMVVGLAPAWIEAQSWNLEQRAVDACQQELQFRMGAESNGGGSGGNSYPPTGRVFFSGGIFNRASGKSLDVQDRSARDAANVQQWDFAQVPNQLWDVIDQGNGVFSIVSQGSGKALDVANHDAAVDVNAGAINENGANVQQWSCSGQPNQQWKLGSR